MGFLFAWLGFFAYVQPVSESGQGNNDDYINRMHNKPGPKRIESPPPQIRCLYVCRSIGFDFIWKCGINNGFIFSSLPKAHSNPCCTFDMLTLDADWDWYWYWDWDGG